MNSQEQTTGNVARLLLTRKSPTVQQAVPPSPSVVDAKPVIEPIHSKRERKKPFSIQQSTKKRILALRVTDKMAQEIETYCIEHQKKITDFILTAITKELRNNKKTSIILNKS